MAEAHSKNTESMHKIRMGVAWYTAAFMRVKNLPPLKEIMGVQKSESKKLDEGGIIALFRNYQQQRDGQKHGDGS